MGVFRLQVWVGGKSCLYTVYIPFSSVGYVQPLFCKGEGEIEGEYKRRTLDVTIDINIILYIRL